MDTSPHPDDRSVGKWGVAARAGYQPVPDVLLIKQRALGLDPVDLLVLLNITSYWWYADKLPFARTTTIAERMGVSVRTVQRSLRKLEEKGYIRREDVRTSDGDYVPAIDPKGLVERLGEMATNDPKLRAKIYGHSTARSLPVEDVM